MQPADRGRGPPPAGGQPESGGHRAVLHPPDWPRPKGYAYGVVAQGRTVFLSGIIGCDAKGRIVGDDFLSQARQALANIVTLLREAGAGPADIVRMTWYITDKRAYLAAQRDLGTVYRDVIGRHFPCMSVVEVAGLLEDRAQVEIEATAVIGDR
jgi:enamine deaminase RidA (YjgF/YER057c/UK114 family)